jgi:uncharacterized protein (TIGR03067 family)
MKRLLGVLLLAGTALAIGADDKKDDAAKEELKKMEGTWLLVSGESNGEMMPAEMVKTIKAVLKGDKLSIHFGDNMVFEGTMTVDPSKKPKTMDTVSAKDKNVKGVAIYELDGDSFKICVGTKGERPTEFTAKKGSGCSLYVYKREKK